MQLTWDERSSDHHAIVSWLEKIFTLSLWETYISAKTPVMICLLTAENLTEVDAIARTARRHEHIPTVTVQIAKHHQYFPGIRQRSLLQTLEKAGLR